MAHQGDHDRVVIASRNADGSPDQTPDFTFIGDKEFSKAATAEQLKQQRVSAADVELRGVGAGASAAGDNAPDKAVQKLIDAHEKAASGAEKDAASEVDGHFEDIAKDTAARRASGTEATAARPATESTASR